MFEFLKNHTFAIGVDMGDDGLRVVQLESNGKDTSLIAAGDKATPSDIKGGSGEWQRWAVGVLRELTSEGNFHGKEITASLPAGEMYIEHMKMPKKTGNEEPEDVIVERMDVKLPFGSENALIRHIPSEDDNIVVMAFEREKVNRHLAIYENAQLALKSMSTWPSALINTYVRFFGRRQSDVESVVMLLDIWSKCTNVVICRHKRLLFAHSIPIGMSRLQSGKGEEASLLLELAGCRRRFVSMYRRGRIERLLLLSAGRGNMTEIDKGIYTTIAERMEMPTQIADCVAAIEMSGQGVSQVDRRGGAGNWAAAFGLSLS